jgi:hypothetical protein
MRNFAKLYYDEEIKEEGMGGACITHEKEEN